MHSLILGITESGKGCLGKALATKLLQSGKTVAVFDPLFEGWPCSFSSHRIEDVSEWMQENRQGYVFIDECGVAFQDTGREYYWLTTHSRHYGHSVTLLAQRLIQIPKTVRDQCSTLHLFTSSLDDAKTLAMEYNQDKLTHAKSLPQFHFLTTNRYCSLQCRKIVDYTRVANVRSIASNTNSRTNRLRGGDSDTDMESDSSTDNGDTRKTITDGGGKTRTDRANTVGRKGDAEVAGNDIATE